MCKRSKRYIRIIHENTEKSREIAEELSKGIEEEGALYLIEEEIKNNQIKVNEDANINRYEEVSVDESAELINDLNRYANNVGISVGIKEKEICVYYQESKDNPLIIYDIDEEEKNEEIAELKTIGKNVAQLIALKPFINLLDD